MRVIGDLIFTLTKVIMDKKCRWDHLSWVTARGDVLKLEILTVNTIQMVI